MGGKRIRKTLLALLGIVGGSFTVPVFMDGEYAKALCNEWNKTPQLVDNLGKSESWIAVPEDGKAMCVYGGPAKGKRGPNDFLMYAETKRWLEMGKKEYGVSLSMDKYPF